MAAARFIFDWCWHTVLCRPKRSVLMARLCKASAVALRRLAGAGQCVESGLGRLRANGLGGYTEPGAVFMKNMFVVGGMLLISALGLGALSVNAMRSWR